MNGQNDIYWNEATWQEINDAVLAEINKVRVAQKVFATTVFEDNPLQIADEVINFSDLSIQEGATKPFVELSAGFSLSDTQVKKETEQHTCLTLARMAAKALALAEDTYFFQTSDRDARRNPDPADSDVTFPAYITVENWRANLDLGLLAEANPADASDEDPTKVIIPIEVPLSQGENAKWGEETFRAVTEGISRLVGKLQAMDYALILPTEVYADTFAPPSTASLVTTADRIRPLVEGGFYVSNVMPPRQGLLVALGGEPVKLFVGREAATEFIQKEGTKYFFRVVERIQYVVRDPRSLILLNFLDETGTGSRGTSIS